MTLLGSVCAALALTAVGGLPAAAASRPRGSVAGAADSPPSDLTVDYRTAPLDVTGTPEFGWLPHAPGTDEDQTAYQIVVTDALTRTVVWNSGTVRSSAESAVPYRGPALAAGGEYTWTVRTWDRQGRVSRYAPEAVFDMGIGDHQWSDAQWIRRPTTGDDSVIDYTLARRQYTLPDPSSPIIRALVYISAEGQWQLHVNGRVIDTQDNYQMPGEGYYDVENITGLARQAQRARGWRANRLAIGVLYGAWATTEGEGRPEGPVPWVTKLTDAAPRGATTLQLADTTGFVAGETLSLGTPGQPGFTVLPITGIDGDTVRLGRSLSADQPAGTTVTSDNGPTGLLVKVVVNHADGSQDTFVSNGTWRVTKDTEEVTTDPTLRSIQNAGTYVESLDARAELTGWDQVGYHETSVWTPPEVMGTAPLPNPSSCANYLSRSSPCGFTHLVPLQAPLTYHVVHPASLTRLPGGTVVVDFGHSLVGVPVVRVPDGRSGHHLVLDGSYRLAGTVLATPAPAGATAITVTGGPEYPDFPAGFQAGDPITIDAPADGYGAGHPEPDVIKSVSGQVITLAWPLRHGHASGVWVQGSLVGTATLDNQGTNLHFYYTEKNGPQTTDFFVPEGFRYLQVSGLTGPVSPADIWVIAQSNATPAGQAATFTSSNATLNAVFALMERSARYAGQMEYQDSPDRQAGQFLADGVNESLAQMAALNERTLTVEFIHDLIDSQRRYWLSEPPGPGSQFGDMNAVYPDGDGKRDIPDFTEQFPQLVWDYYMASGDVATLREAYPAMVDVARYVSDNIATTGGAAGLVYQLPGGGGAYTYGIIDWPPPMRYDTTVLNAGADTVVNMRAAGLFRDVAMAASVLGHPRQAAAFTGQLHSLVEAINTKLVGPHGLYVDGLEPSAGNPQIPNVSEHDQSFALAYKVAPADEIPELGAYIAAQGMQQGPMDLGQLEEALIAADQPAALVHLLTDPTADGPAKILAEGGTSMWEEWDPGCGAPGGAPGDSTASCTGSGINQNSPESFSHGWGSVGIVGILQGLLGVTVTSPGAATLTIHPPSAGLARARGSVWTQRGEVTVSWAREGNGFREDVRIPDNVQADVYVPADGPDTVHVSGPPAAARFLRMDGHDAVYRVGSGRTVFWSSRADLLGSSHP